MRFIYLSTTILCSILIGCSGKKTVNLKVKELINDKVSKVYPISVISENDTTKIVLEFKDTDTLVNDVHHFMTSYLISQNIKLLEDNIEVCKAYQTECDIQLAQ